MLIYLADRPASAIRAQAVEALPQLSCVEGPH